MPSREKSATRPNRSMFTYVLRAPPIGNGLNMVSESTVSNTELSELFCPHRVLGRELIELEPVQPVMCVPKNSPSLSQNSPSLVQSSVSSLPGHLGPVIRKPVGRMFEINDSNPIRGECKKYRRSLSSQRNKGLRGFHRAKRRKCGKRGKCRDENAENAENAADCLQP